MSDLNELIKELMKNPEFRKEYEAFQPEIDILRKKIDGRVHDGKCHVMLSGKEEADTLGNDQ